MTADVLPMNSENLREPPANIAAEKALLGAILVTNRVYEEVADFLRPEHFSINPNRMVYTAISHLLAKGTVADSVTLKHYFADAQALSVVGGAKYLNDLTMSAVTAINAVEYARLVLDLAEKREALLIAQTVVEQCYSGQDMTASDIRAGLEAALNAVHGDVRTGPAHISRYVEEALTSARAAADGGVAGLPTGLIDLDRKTGGIFPGDLIVLAGATGMGKSAALMTIAGNLAETGAAVGIVCLEMTGVQIAIREIAARCHVSATDIRAGRFEDPDYAAMEAAGARISDLPMHLDVATNLDIGTLRIRARRLQRMHGIKMLGVDYLQLMSSAGENRTQEVSKITRGLKGIALDLGIPVVALSQLHRGIAGRDDKRPMLSDLRDSGCLSTKTTLLVGPDIVQYNNPSPMSVGTLNKGGKIVMAESTNLDRRDKELIRLKLRTGKFIDCTLDHPILTDLGWVPAGEITTDHAIACAASLPEPAGAQPIPHARWIGWMLGNGSMLGYSSPSFICSCDALAAEFVSETERLFGLTPRPHAHACAAVFQYDITAGPVRTKEGNPCKDWLRQHGLWGRRAPEKMVPDWFIEQADNQSVAELIGGLIDTDGSVPRFSTKRGAVKFSTTSRKMAWQVVWGLLRLGIYARIDDGYDDGNDQHHVVYTVHIQDGPTLEKFKSAVRLAGRKGKALGEIPTGGVSNHGNRLGTWVGKELVAAAREQGISQSRLGYRDQKKRISQDDLRKFLRCLDVVPDRLGWLTNRAIWWDRLRETTFLGPGPVFDREVADDGHNFIANGIIVHNSVEQDADTVWFIHREEYYAEKAVPAHSNGRETTAAYEDRLADAMARLDKCRNEAELDVAKQRMGPTGSLKLYFDKVRIRFGNWGGSGG